MNLPSKQTGLAPQHRAIAVVFFGPKKLPELGKGLAEGIRGFKESMKDHSDSKDEKPGA